MCKSCGARVASLHNPSQSSVILTTVNSDRDFTMVTVGFRSRCTLKTDVTSSRDIPRTWAPWISRRERKSEREEEKVDGRLRTGTLRTSSRRSLVASSRMRMLAYAIPYGPRTQPAKHNFARALLIQQKRATDVQIRRNWILTSTLPIYPSMRRETMQAYARTRPFTFGISGTDATRNLVQTALL